MSLFSLPVVWRVVFLFHQVGLDPHCSWSFAVVFEAGCVLTGGVTTDTLYSEVFFMMKFREK